MKPGNENKGRKGKRGLIIEAAVQEFSSKGYHDTRMEQIAIRAGIGKGTIYEYFTSKLQLFQSMMEESLHAYYTTLSEEDLHQLPVEERLKFLFEAHTRFCLEHKELTRIIFFDGGPPVNELREWAMAMAADKMKRMMGILQEGIDRGEIRDLDARVMALVVNHSMGAFWYPLVVEGWDKDAGLLSKNYIDMIMNGIKKTVN